MESELYALLLPLASGGVWPDVADETVQPPYITYLQIGGDVISPVAGEYVANRNAVMRVTVWTATRLSTVAPMQSVEQTLVTTKVFTARPKSALTALYDETVKFYGASQDFSIWGTR